MKKLYATLGVLLIALSVAGFVYADWTQTIYIDGTVETGEYCMGFTACDCDDDGPDPRPNEGYPAKDVASCTCDLQVEKGTHGTDICYERVVITIADAYPCYTCKVDITISNCGDIPAAVDGLVQTTAPAAWVAISVSEDPVGEQIDPCGSLTFDLVIHIMQDAPSDGTGSTTFVYALYTKQWNMYP